MLNHGCTDSTFGMKNQISFRTNTGGSVGGILGQS